MSRRAPTPRAQATHPDRECLFVSWPHEKFTANNSAAAIPAFLPHGRPGATVHPIERLQSFPRRREDAPEGTMRMCWNSIESRVFS